MKNLNDIEKWCFEAAKLNIETGNPIESIIGTNLLLAIERLDKELTKIKAFNQYVIRTLGDE